MVRWQTSENSLNWGGLGREDKVQPVCPGHRQPRVRTAAPRLVKQPLNVEIICGWAEADKNCFCSWRLYQKMGGIHRIGGRARRAARTANARTVLSESRAPDRSALQTAAALIAIFRKVSYNLHQTSTLLQLDSKIQFSCPFCQINLHEHYYTIVPSN